MALKAALGAVVVVTKVRALLSALLIFTISQHSLAAVLPPDRADVLYHSYDGGGVTIAGPSILVQKQVSDSFSLSANYYVDMVSSASIDVVTTASQYKEERKENTIGVNYLRGKSAINVAFTTSEENDFNAKSLHFGISQDMFGDLTTVSLGYSRGWDIVGQRGLPNFAEKTNRHNFRLGLTQVITKNLIMQAGLETITDEGYLNNPYRQVRYIDSTAARGYSYQSEIYPRTRISNAISLKARYFLPYRAALHAEYRTFVDSWGVAANIFEVGYTHPFRDDWIFDVNFRNYKQTQATFYRDLFPYINAQNFMARDKELSAHSNNSIGMGVSYEFAKGEGGIIDKASLNFNINHIEFNYENFRDARQTSYAAGTEPLYKLSANVIQFFVSVWF